MIGKNIQETYGVRIWKVYNKNEKNEERTVCLEYPYHTLSDIYKNTTKYNNEQELSSSIATSLKQKHNDKYDGNCFYEAQIVYYPNKKLTKELVNINPDYTMTNGETSEDMPILYSDNIDIFDEEKTRKRYEELVGNERFRRRVSNLFWETEGLSKIAKAYRHSELQIDSERYGMKLYEAISKGFKWYTAIYLLMNREFQIPLINQEQQDVVPKETGEKLLKVSFKDWVLCPSNVQKLLSSEKPTSEELHWLGQFGISGDILKYKELQDKDYEKSSHKKL